MTEIHTLSLTEIIHHWLLNTVVEFGVPLVCVFPEAGHGLNVKPVPTCSSEDYAKGLLALFDSGLITFCSKVPGDDTEKHDGVRQLLQRFQTLSKDDVSLRGQYGLLPTHRLRQLPGMQVGFRLTTCGGETWEKVAQPRWNRYVSVSSTLTTAELISAERDVLFAYMGWYPQLNGERIQLQTIKLETHTNFKIVYWKRVPFVYHASFGIEPAVRRWASDEPSWFRDWRSTQSWYTPPWHLPGWPSP
jgi:hypothetical protein